MTRFSRDGDRLPTLERERPPEGYLLVTFRYRHETELDHVT
jgi:hypothetical protein